MQNYDMMVKNQKKDEDFADNSAIIRF